MRKLAIAMALASTGLATPAVARDNSPYVGVEGGILIVEDMDVDYDDGTLDIANAITVTHNTGFDVDVIAGYDFGMLRLEGELGYKRASVNQLRIDPRIAGGGPGDNYDADGRARALSAMINLLLDFGDDDGLSGYAGAGIGLASVKYSADAVTPAGAVEFSDTDSGLAWQGILGLRYAVGQNIDLGLKYRFFNVPNLKYAGTDDAGLGITLDGRWRSHSLLASLIYNFAAPPPPPPPAAASAASAAASGDADVPGRLGDPGDGHLPGTAASASAAATGARARSVISAKKGTGPSSRSGRFSFARSRRCRWRTQAPTTINQCRVRPARER